MTPCRNTFLAFDTATESMSVAVSVAGRVFVHEGPGAAQASATLLPAILGLLERAGVTLQGLDGIAFGRGPGAFTGLRTACSVAQGLAFGAGKPVLPIDTLLAVAEDARGGAVEMSVWVMMDARMGEIYAAQYRFTSARWQVLTAPMLTTAQALNLRWSLEAPEVVAGNALIAYADELRPGVARVLAHALPRAGGMLLLAQALWDAGGSVDAALALPLYVRDKVAQTTVERDAARAAKGAMVSPL